jgi:hypothetical protein
VILRGDAGGNVVSADVDARPGVDCGDLPGHCHGASVGRVVGDEVDGLHHPHTRDDVDKTGFDDVGVRGGLAACTRGVRVGQHEPV